MHPLLPLVLQMFAFVLFVCSALGVPSPPRCNLQAAGLALWVLSTFVTAL